MRTKHHFNILTGQEKGRFECLWEFQIFSPEIIAQIFEEKYLFFKSPISPWRGPQWKSLFWAFFLNSLRNHTTQKIRFHWGPLLAFPNDLRNICKFCFINICCKFLGQKSGSLPSQRSLDFDKNIFFHWEIRPYFWTFFGYKTP